MKERMNSKDSQALISRLYEFDAITKKRALNDSERKEFEAISAKLAESENDNKVKNTMNKRDNLKAVGEYVRSLQTANGTKGTMNFRATYDASDAVADGMIPSIIMESKSFMPQSIFDLVGIEIEYNVKGKPLWPYISSRATVSVGTSDGSALTTTEYGLTTVNVQPERLGIDARVTNLAEYLTDDAIGRITTQALPEDFAAKVDEILFSRSKLSGFTNVQGPLVGLSATIGLDAQGAVKVKTLNECKAEILKAGGKLDKMAWVCDPYTYATLELTPIDAGSGKMVIENGKMFGLPVYATPYIYDSTNNDGYIAIGDWRCCPTYFTQTPSIVVDTLTRLSEGETKYVMASAISVNPLNNSNMFKLIKMATA